MSENKSIIDNIIQAYVVETKTDRYFLIMGISVRNGNRCRRRLPTISVVDKIQMRSIQTGTLCTGVDTFDDMDEYNNYIYNKRESEVKFNEFYERAGNYLKECGLIGETDVVEHHILIL